MPCLFDAETECCTCCGASFEKYRAAGSTCLSGGGRVVHLDRALARRHHDRLTALIRALQMEAARLAAVRRREEVDALFDVYDSRDP
jgi:ethanolamine utilization protein EutA (predicted chaperonin)